MKFLSFNSGLKAGASAVSILALSFLVPAQARAFDWPVYMQTAAMAGAITSAIAQVDDCSKPLLFEEIATDDLSSKILVFTCPGSEDEEGSAILRIQRFGEGPWFPAGFEFAG